MAKCLVRCALAIRTGITTTGRRWRDDRMTRPDGFTTRDPWTWLHDNEFSWDDVNAIAAILDAGGFDIVRIEALETIFDRLGDVFNLMHPGELTDDEREGIAQGVWFAMHDCKRALGDLEWPRDPEALVIR